VCLAPLPSDRKGAPGHFGERTRGREKTGGDEDGNVERVTDGRGYREKIRNKMIRFIFIQNVQGKTRMAKYYVPYEDSEKHKIEYEVHRLVSSRNAKFANTVEVSLPSIPFALRDTGCARRSLHGSRG